MSNYGCHVRSCPLRERGHCDGNRPDEDLCLRRWEQDLRAVRRAHLASMAGLGLAGLGMAAGLALLWHCGPGPW